MKKRKRWMEAERKIKEEEDGRRGG